MFPWRIDHLLVETRFETIFWNFYLFNDKNFIYKNQKKIITKSKPKRIMKNTKRKVSYDKSVAKSYRNEICSYKNLEVFKTFTGGFPFLCSLERDLVGRPTNGDSRGEAVISVQTHHLIRYLEARRKDCPQIRLKLF